MTVFFSAKPPYFGSPDIFPFLFGGSCQIHDALYNLPKWRHGRSRLSWKKPAADGRHLPTTNLKLFLHVALCYPTARKDFRSVGGRAGVGPGRELELPKVTGWVWLKFSEKKAPFFSNLGNCCSIQLSRVFQVHEVFLSENPSSCCGLLLFNPLNPSAQVDFISNTEKKYDTRRWAQLSWCLGVSTRQGGVMTIPNDSLWLWVMNTLPKN